MTRKHCFVDVGFGVVRKDVCKYCDIERTKSESSGQGDWDCPKHPDRDKGGFADFVLDDTALEKFRQAFNNFVTKT